MPDYAVAPLQPEKIPLSLYIHLPWCLHKCPYCDFNSHATNIGEFPEQTYVDALIADLIHAQAMLQSRELVSIFLGGGTPSLFTAKSIQAIMNACQQHTQLRADCEITLEANPGTFEYEKFGEFHAAGVNRLSIGVQSFNQKHLTQLQRIHSEHEAQNAITTAQQIGFDNINIDLMFGLPEQSEQEALQDIQTACTFGVSHISYYQLTLEPNTVFHRFPPALPSSDQCWEIQNKCIDMLHAADYQRYEVSAYARDQQRCMHNQNYWQYGDYLGIGAGAHSKISSHQGVMRFAKPRQPESYLRAIQTNNHLLQQRTLNEAEITFEFMLNNLRLCQGFTQDTFRLHTGLGWDRIQPHIMEAVDAGLLEVNDQQVMATPDGYRFLDTLLERFLPESLCG